MESEFYTDFKSLLNKKILIDLDPENKNLQKDFQKDYISEYKIFIQKYPEIDTTMDELFPENETVPNNVIALKNFLKGNFPRINKEKFLLLLGDSQFDNLFLAWY